MSIVLLDLIIAHPLKVKMTAPLIQSASGIEEKQLTYASTNENNKEIYTFTANEPVSWAIGVGETRYEVLLGFS